MNAEYYLTHAGVSADASAVSGHRAQYLAVAESAKPPSDTTGLYRYVVPELGENGACSLPDQLASEPYDLAATLGGANTSNTARLAALHALVAAVATDTGCGWLGVYQARTVADGKALVKLAYRGKPSRAEFPLTEDFAAHSNNSTVGLSGKGRIIDSVDSYLADGGAYYTCDAAVQSEVCLPIFADDGTVIGIVDAEDERRGYFQGEVLARIVALCLVVPNHLPG
ncbi:MAG: hypothetical protein JO142_15780 [Burkholderiales bacterium]|nr:hypothetical protein [Burkholderiales bacterium]